MEATGQEVAISTRLKIRLPIHDFFKKYFNQEPFLKCKAVPRTFQIQTDSIRHYL